MTISDVLNVTGGNTKVILYGISSNSKYMKLWTGIVDDIEFKNIPFGYYKVEHLTVINDEDNLVLQFNYPSLTNMQKAIVGKLAIGCPYPTEWVEMLYVKYRNTKKIKEILSWDKEKVYDEIKTLN